MADAVGRVLGKPGAYRLGEGRPPHAGDVARSVRLLLASALGLAAVAIGLLATRQPG